MTVYFTLRDSLSGLTLLVEVVNVHICDNKVAVLLDSVLVPLLESAREHDDKFLLGYTYRNESHKGSVRFRLDW